MKIRQPAGVPHASSSSRERQPRQGQTSRPGHPAPSDLESISPRLPGSSNPRAVVVIHGCGDRVTVSGHPAMNNATSNPDAAGTGWPGPGAGGKVRRRPSAVRSCSGTAAASTSQGTGIGDTRGEYRLPQCWEKRPVSGCLSPASPRPPNGGLEGGGRGAGRCGGPVPDGPVTGMAHGAACGAVWPGAGCAGARGGTEPLEGPCAVCPCRRDARTTACTHTIACTGAGRAGGRA